MQWFDINPYTIKLIGFSTSSASSGEFKIWRKESNGQTYTDLMKLEVPPNAIPGSATGEVIVIGDVMGPTLKNLDRLLTLPFGCGEQNMINFAPNIYVLDYLHGTQQLKPESEKLSLDYLVRGYQRQLTYCRQDGSYAAFGERDPSGSMWLTAFVLSSFSRASKYIFVDDTELHSASEWIIRRQTPEGSFPLIGRVYNQDIQGGAGNELALTAFVLGALLDAKADDVAIIKARDYLEKNVHNATSAYTIALMAYTLSRVDSGFAPIMLQKLNDRAQVQQSFKYWTGTADKGSQTAAGVEITSYALLSYVSMREVSEALPIVKWISLNRNILGGFRTTQDTCVALRALSAYAILAYMGGMNISIQLASTNLDMDSSFTINDEKSDVINRSQIPTLPAELFVNSNGTGCALMQVNIKYNLPEPKTAEQFAFDIKVDVHTTHNGNVAQTFDEFDVKTKIYKHKTILEDNVFIRACMKWNYVGTESNMAVLEIPVLLGYQADLESIERLFSTQSSLKRYDVTENRILFYFDEISFVCWTCIQFELYHEFKVTNSKPRLIKLYDYYEPSQMANLFYSADAVDATIGDINECKCNETAQCSYRGPSVCGDDGVVYRNECKMRMASCEAGKEIVLVADHAECTTTITAGNGECNLRAFLTETVHLSQRTNTARPDASERY